MKRSIGKMLNLQSRSGPNRAGRHKTNEAEVRTFKQRLKEGQPMNKAREGLKISEQSARDIASGRSWSWVILSLIALALLGNKCPTNAQGANDRRACWDYDYPLCSDVPRTYPCLCVQGSRAVTSEADERELYNPTPTPGYQYEGGSEGA